MENKNIKVEEIRVEGKIWEEAMEKAFDKANSKVKIDGFRSGKAPKEVFLKKYGKEALYIDAADIAIQGAYAELLNKIGELEIVTQPSVDLKSLDENGATYVFTLTLKPEVKLGQYKKLSVAKEEVSVSKEEIEKSLEDTLNRYAEEVSKDGNVANGDTAVIDFEGFDNGVAFAGGKGENHPLVIGSGSFIPGFEEQIIGMAKGEEKDIEVTFPEEYHSEDLKGKPVVFKVKVNDIKATKLPEMNADFFEDLGLEGIDSKEKLEEQLKETIAARKEVEVENKYVDALLEEAGKHTEVEIPQVMVDEEVNRMLGQYAENLKMQGITLDLYYQFTNSTEADLKMQMTEEANKRVKFRLVLEEIAKVENVEISDQQAEEEAVKLAEKYKMEKEEFLKAFGGLDMIKYDLKMRGAIEVLKG